MAHYDADPGADVRKLERAYERRLRKLANRAARETTQNLLDDLDDLVGIGGPGARRKIVARANRIARELKKQIDRKTIERDASRIAGAAWRASGNRFRAHARKAGLDRDRRQAGLDIDVEEDVREWTKGQIEAVHRAIEAHRQGLIRSLVDEWRPGTKPETLRKRAIHRLGVLERRISRIARDEAQAILGRFDAKRQQASGATAYKWHHQGDAKVRPSHRARGGKVFQWDDPPSDGHPGQPPNCRCWAEPVWGDEAKPKPKVDPKRKPKAKPKAPAVEPDPVSVEPEVPRRKLAGQVEEGDEIHVAGVPGKVVGVRASSGRREITTEIEGRRVVLTVSPDEDVDAPEDESPVDSMRRFNGRVAGKMSQGDAEFVAARVIDRVANEGVPREQRAIVSSTHDGRRKFSRFKVRSRSGNPLASTVEDEAASLTEDLAIKFEVSRLDFMKLRQKNAAGLAYPGDRHVEIHDLSDVAYSATLQNAAASAKDGRAPFLASGYLEAALSPDRAVRARAQIRQTTAHEIGHTLDFTLRKDRDPNDPIRNAIADAWADMRATLTPQEAAKLSRYAASDADGAKYEFFAEAFSAARLGHEDKIPERFRPLFEILTLRRE